MSNVVTPEQVYDLAGISVDSTLISRAQLNITTASGFDLSDATAFAALRLRDQRHLTTAVVWQVVYLDRHPDLDEHPANVVRASANGASIEFRDGDDGTFAPLALRELEGLSWRQKRVTVSTLRPYSLAARREADVWTDTTTRVPPLPYVARGPQPDPWR